MQNTGLLGTQSRAGQLSRQLAWAECKGGTNYISWLLSSRSFKNQSNELFKYLFELTKKVGHTTDPSCGHSTLSNLFCIFIWCERGWEKLHTLAAVIRSVTIKSQDQSDEFMHIFGLSVKMGQTYFEIWDKLYLLQHTWLSPISKSFFNSSISFIKIREER